MLYNQVGECCGKQNLAVQFFAERIDLFRLTARIKCYFNNGTEVAVGDRLLDIMAVRSTAEDRIFSNFVFAFSILAEFYNLGIITSLLIVNGIVNKINSVENKRGELSV